jgi:LCP family protein required for cell wall assembly
MSDTSDADFFVRQYEKASSPEPTDPPRRSNRRSRRGRAWRRIAIAAVVSVFALTGAVVGASHVLLNHLAGSVHRIRGITALDAANKPILPAATRDSMTVLLAGSGRPGATGLIELLHLNAHSDSGAVISIPANAYVHVPGHGKMEIGNAIGFGGPSLLIETVERLTGVPIDHYSVLNFAGLPRLVQAMGGVDVDVPFTTTSFGVTFRAGITHLNAGDVLQYLRQPAVSEVGREELQENLIRAIVDKLASQHMLSQVTNDYHVMDALTSAVSVDSNFTNSQLESLALRLGEMRDADPAFVDAPTNGSSVSGQDKRVTLDRRLSAELWSAIRNDAVAAFAREHPSLVTPSAPG